MGTQQTYLAMTGPVVPQTEDLRRGLRGALTPGLALVDPVAEVNLITTVSHDIVTIAP